MKNRKLFTALILLAAFSFGCASKVPYATNFPMASQQKVRSTHHWDVIASDVVDQAVKSLEAGNTLKGRSLFVQKPKQDVAFLNGFQGFLVTNMVDRNLPVSSVPEGALEVSYETIVVDHASSRANEVPGKLTTLAAGVMVVRDLVYGTASHWLSGGIILATTAIVDYGSNRLTDTSYTEMIVTTSITDNGVYVMRKSDVYYIPSEDKDLFAAPTPVATKTFEVKAE